MRNKFTLALLLAASSLSAQTTHPECDHVEAGQNSTVEGYNATSCIEIVLNGEGTKIRDVHAPKVYIIDKGHTFFTRKVDGFTDGEHNARTVKPKS